MPVFTALKIRNPIANAAIRTKIPSVHSDILSFKKEGEAIRRKDIFFDFLETFLIDSKDPKSQQPNTPENHIYVWTSFPDEAVYYRPAVKANTICSTILRTSHEKM
jgi:hypothetical protein